MRDALIRASQEYPGDLGMRIHQAAKRNKPRKFGGWFVIRKQKGERRVRRNR